MHRDEWDDEDAEPGTYTRYLVGFFTYKVARKSLGLLEVLIKKFLRCTVISVRPWNFKDGGS